MPISSAYSTAVGGFSGQPGNALPRVGLGSSDVAFLDYGIMAGWHRPVNLMTASTLGNTIGSSMSGSLIYYQGYAGTTTGEIQITLPDPQPGLWFEFAGFGAHNATAVTEWDTASATGCFLVFGDSGGADKVSLSSTLIDPLIRLEFVGISTAHYVASYKLSGSSIMVSTAYLGIDAPS